MSERAIEAAVKAAYVACDASYVGELRPDQMVTIDGLADLKAMFTAAIRAYLAALAEDDAAVEKVARAITAYQNPIDTYVDPEDQKITIENEWDAWAGTTRAALRALGE